MHALQSIVLGRRVYVPERAVEGGGDAPFDCNMCVTSSAQAVLRFTGAGDIVLLSQVTVGASFCFGSVQLEQRNDGALDVGDPEWVLV